MAFKKPAAIVQSELEFQRAISTALRPNHVGDWGSDHNQEAKSFSGWNYLAIAAIGRMAARAIGYVYSAEKPKVAAMRKSLRLAHGSLWKSFADDGAADAVPEDHWVSKLVHRPNPHQTASVFQWEFSQQLHLHGCCLIFNRPNQDGSRIVQRYIVPMALTQPIYPGSEKNCPNGGIRILPQAAGLGLWVSPLIRTLSGATVPIEWLSIVRYPHPVLRGDGRSPTDAAGHWIDTATMTDIARWKQLKRGPRPHGVVTVDQDNVSDELLDAVENRLNQKLADETYDQRVMAVAKGVNVPSDATPVDMDYVNSFDQIGQAILAVHGSGKAMVGLTDNMTYGSLAAALQQAASVVQSDMDLLADDTTMLAREYGAEVDVQYEVPQYDDPQLVEQQLQTDLSAGIRTGREWRALRGLRPYGDWRDNARVTTQGFVQDTQPPQQQGQQPPAMGFSDAQSPIEGKTPDQQVSLAKAMNKLDMAKAYRKPHFTWRSGERPPIVAVDLDGTLAADLDDFDPNMIGEPIQSVVDHVRALKDAGCQIVIFTCRDNDGLVQVWLDQAGVPWDSLNANPEGFEGSGKVFADVYWDNRGVNVDEGLRAVAKRLPDGPAKIRLLSSTERSSECGVVMLELGEPVTSLVSEDQARIDVGALRESGLEEWPHITLLYGVVGTPSKEIVDAVRRLDQFDVTFGKVSTFEQPGGVAVLKVDVESPAIHRAHERLLAALPVKEQYPTYCPHLTLAYVDEHSPEALNTPYACGLSGKSATVTHAIVVVDGERIRVPLRAGYERKQRETFPIAANFEDSNIFRPAAQVESFAKRDAADYSQRLAQCLGRRDPLGIEGWKSEVVVPVEQSVVAAGLALVARDTGRFLMLQRALSDDDPASGKWEFPGGHVEPGESPLDAAIREWEEEVGQPLPSSLEPIAMWDCGKYVGFVAIIDSEADIAINSDVRRVLNPDDPDQDMVEVVAWWREPEITDNEAIRDELRQSAEVVRAAIAKANAHLSSFAKALAGSNRLASFAKGSPNQPRDDSGRWVSSGSAAEAAGSVEKAAELFAGVNKPDQRAKLVKFLQEKGMSEADALKAQDLADSKASQPAAAAPATPATPAGESVAPKPTPPVVTGDKPRKFKTGNDAEKTLATSSKEWHDKIDFDGQMGLRGYAGTSDSFQINKGLREGKLDNPRHKQTVERVTAALDTASFPEHVETYRTINVSSPEERQAILDRFSAHIGKSIVDKAFVSTTANQKYAQKWAERSKDQPIQVKVVVPKGAKAAYLAKDVVGYQEWEVLIQRNSKFKVHSVENGVVSLELQ